jgi:hypothetical protein
MTTIWKRRMPRGRRATAAAVALAAAVVTGCTSTHAALHQPEIGVTPPALWNSATNPPPAGTLLLDTSGIGSRTFRLAPSGTAHLTVRVSCVSSGRAASHASFTGSRGYLLLGFGCEADVPAGLQAIFGSAGVDIAKAGRVLRLTVDGRSRWKLAIWAT